MENVNKNNIEGPMHGRFLLALVLLLLGACRHPLAIVGQGDIVDRNGSSYGCTLEQFQAQDVACTGFDFTEDYIVNYEAVPRPGWRFVGWEGPCKKESVAPFCALDAPLNFSQAMDQLFPGVPMPATTAVFEPEPSPSLTYFNDHVSTQVIDSVCSLCHVGGGPASGTQLVYETGGDSQATNANYITLRDFILADDGNVDLLLGKARGINHGGGAPLPPESDNYQSLSEFINLVLNCGTACGGPAINLFDNVVMANAEQTLRRAAVILAGRLPTAQEFSQANIDDDGLRVAIRGLMEGQGFHDFLIEGANDRLLTDRWLTAEIYNQISFEFPNLVDIAFPILETAHNTTGDPFPREWEAFLWKTNYGAARAPTELIAHVAENDLAYTEILTADYVMVNPFLAQAYGSIATFNDPEDPTEFQPGRLEKYLRIGDDEQHGESIQIECIDVTAVICKILGGGIETDYPHAGVLNSHAFLKRYPSTETNRNRARSRWTYYHFLGLDIEKSANRTSDPTALADNDNPTLKNENCTVCHITMDPVAGAFQNYGDLGLYKDQAGGRDSLPDNYKYGGEQGSVQESTRSVLIYDGNDGSDDWFAWDAFIEGQFQDPGLGGCCPGVGARDSDVTFRVEARGDELDAYRNGELLTTGTIGDSLGPLREPGHIALFTWYPTEKRFDAVRVWDTSSGSAQLVFEDHFDNGASEYWQPVEGNWSAQDGYYSNTSDGVTLLRLDALGIDGLTDFIVELDVLNAQPGIGIWLRTHPLPSLTTYRDGDVWYRDMLEAGFGEQLAPSTDNSMQWLAQQIVQDSRFATASVRFWWPAVMGLEAIEAPQESSDFDYQARLAAFDAQDAVIRSLGEGFAAGFGDGQAFNLKDLLVEMIMSDWFRAADTTADLDESAQTRLEDAGIPRLLTPEQLARKTRAVTGLVWGEHDWDLSSYIKVNELTNNRLNYGGIDSEGVTTRNTELTAVMMDVGLANATNIACPAVALDLVKPAEERLLLPDVELADTPENAATAIKQALVHWHWVMWGKRVDVDSAELTASFDLLNTLWTRKRAEDPTWLDGTINACNYDFDVAGIAWEDWGEDPTHMRQTWNAMLVYFLSDFQFLHD
jgi:hypothetical protein